MSVAQPEVPQGAPQDAARGIAPAHAEIGLGTPFDVLPLIVQSAGDDWPDWFRIPNGALLEVDLTHPEYGWWHKLAPRRHAVPALADMCPKNGGIWCPAAPFNGWYMAIGSRRLGCGLVKYPAYGLDRW
ncbi:nitric oxide synthase oxygenase [Streptomyces sp. NPDC002092]